MEDILEIVIADDNKLIADMIKKKIEDDKRCKVVGIANDEESEMLLIDKLKPNLVITDLRKKNGWTGINIIEKYQYCEYKPTFFIISASIVDYIETIRKLEIQYYLSKPYNEYDLMRIINDIYNDVYPKAIIELNNNIIKNDNRSFWNMIIEKFKRIGQY